VSVFSFLFPKVYEAELDASGMDYLRCATVNPMGEPSQEQNLPIFLFYFQKFMKQRF